MNTWREVAHRYEFWMDGAMWLNIFGVYMYLCLVGSNDAPALILLAGLNIALITIARRDELKKILTPPKDKDELHTIIRRIK